MPAQVIFLPPASREYQKARQWYAQRSIQVAQRFRDAVDEAVGKIAARPLSWPLYDHASRWIRVARFPYLLYYQVVTDTQVVVLAVAHDSRRPGYWRRRRRP